MGRFLQSLLGPEDADVSPEHDAEDDEAVVGGVRGDRLSIDRRGRLVGSLVSFRPPESMQEELIARNIYVQPIEKGRGSVQIDYYGVDITRLPKNPAGTGRLTPDGLVEYLRKNLGEFIEPDLASFEPLSPADRRRWRSSDPAGAVLAVDLRGPDDGAVVCARRHHSDETKLGSFTFSTVRSKSTGRHPLSGNRKVGISRRSDGSHVLYAKGVHRLSTIRGVAASPLQLRTEDEVWYAFQQRVVNFVLENDGRATEGITTAQRYKWKSVERNHFEPTVSLVSGTE